jgi:hypothetical protein
MGPVCARAGAAQPRDGMAAGHRPTISSQFSRFTAAKLAFGPVDLTLQAWLATTSSGARDHAPDYGADILYDRVAEPAKGYRESAKHRWLSVDQYPDVMVACGREGVVSHYLYSHPSAA